MADAKLSALTDGGAPQASDLLYVARAGAPYRIAYSGLAAQFAATSHTHSEGDVTGLTAALAGKQDELVSGTNIKTINGSSILGSGDLVVGGGGGTPGGSSGQVQYNSSGAFAGTPSIAVGTNGGVTIAAPNVFSGTGASVSISAGHNYAGGVGGNLDLSAGISSAGGGVLTLGAPTAGAVRVNHDALRIMTPRTPAAAGAAGTTGDICWDSNYVYVCVATNTWKRSALSTW